MAIFGVVLIPKNGKKNHLQRILRMLSMFPHIWNPRHHRMASFSLKKMEQFLMGVLNTCVIWTAHKQWTRPLDVSCMITEYQMFIDCYDKSFICNKIVWNRRCEFKLLKVWKSLPFLCFFIPLLVDVSSPNINMDSFFQNYFSLFYKY